MSSAHTASRINDTLYEIHRDISQPLGANYLAKIAALSEPHFHRVFKAQVGEAVHSYIRRIRLEQAANQLMFDHASPIQDIAVKCGFQSLSSFSRAFKTQFSATPGAWRRQQHEIKIKGREKDSAIEAAFMKMQRQPLPQAELVQCQAIEVAYLRHRGYDRGIRNTWQKLQAWALQTGRDDTQQFALHHSNPAWTALEHCRYVACIGIDKPLAKRAMVNSLTIPGGLHARFDLEGKYGEFLPQLSKVMQQWLPQSGFKMRTTPCWVHYTKNQFLTKDESFVLSFYLPLGIY